MKNNSLYKKFRNVNDIIKPEKGILTKRFDEPTYFSFRLIFATDSDKNYNNASDTAVYDIMPHPLFNVAERISVAADPYTVMPEESQYSALQYLINANEPTRAEMLREFIEKFETLQYNFPYYFQSVDGISDLLKVDTAKGQRILNDKKITITCLEALDLRMSYLLNLYKKIAWDDVYQRWVLPDMMRYFTLKIYLSEFRTFHTAAFSENQAISGYSSNANSGNETTPLYLAILDDILPTWEITCEMCEFDLNDISFEHLNNLSVATDPVQGAIKFGIKVGNIKELQTYPVFKHMFLSDRKLNAINRSREEISTLSDANNSYLYPASLQIAQARDMGDSLNRHISGRPYNEDTNSDKMYGQGGPGSDKIWGNSDDDTIPLNPTQPETWVGNAIGFGTAYAKSFANKIVDKAKMFSVPNLGISFNEVKAVLQSKDIIGALGLIRKGVNDVVESYGNAPSSRLQQPLKTDEIMMNFLTTLSKSEATDDDTKLLQGAANMALSDKGTWEKIKDYSLATNLVGKGEQNTPKDLQGTAQFRSVVEQQAALSSISKDLDKNSAMPQIVPNAASNKNIQNDSNISKVGASSELTENIKTNSIDIGLASSNLGKNIQTNNVKTDAASSKLTSGISSDSVDRIAASVNLSNSEIKQNVKGQEIASSKLNSDIKNTTLSGIEASKELSDQIKGTLKSGTASEKLSSQISETAVNTSLKKTAGIDTNAKINTDKSVKSTTISAGRIIEAEPSRILISKMETESLKQPPVSRATLNEIEDQKSENITNSKATTSKLDKMGELKEDSVSKATTQELFSK